MKEIDRLQSLFRQYLRNNNCKGNYIIRTDFERLNGFGSLKKLTVEIYYREGKDNKLIYTFECKEVDDNELYQEAEYKLFEFFMNHGRDYITK